MKTASTKVIPFYGQVCIGENPAIEYDGREFPEWTEENLDKGFAPADRSVLVGTINDLDNDNDDLAEVEIIVTQQSDLVDKTSYYLICEVSLRLKDHVLSVGDVLSDDYQLFDLDAELDARYHMSIYGHLGRDSDRPDKLIIVL